MYSLAQARKVVIAPLDWGLGHATRIIPIIRFLLESGRVPTVAANPVGIRMLRMEFPHLEYLILPGYEIDYPRSGRYFMLHMLRRLPRMVRAIVREHQWLKRAQERHRWDFVISDNRYGFRHPDIPSFFLTHQINIRTGMGSWADKVVKKVNHGLIARFDACWIPDGEAAPGLAGALSHGGLPPRARYIGPLSRLSTPDWRARAGTIVLLSGPEPQRSLLENIFLKELPTHLSPVILVRGLPDAGALPEVASRHKILNYVPAVELGELLAGAALVICRSGYSTVMDLVRTGTPAVLIPTPGQTEQEYLARHLEAAGCFPFLPQEGCSLAAAAARARDFPFQTIPVDFNAHRSVLGDMLPAIIQPANPSKH